MKFLVSVIDSATGSGTPEEMRAIDAFNARLAAAGQLVLATGMAAPVEAKVVDGRGAEPVVVDGALHQGEEYLSGFWVLEAADGETALGLAVEASGACQRRVEVRALL